MPFRRRNASQEAARQTIQDAFKELEKAVSPADTRDFKFDDATLENVEKATLALENQLAARSCMRNMGRLAPLFQGLDFYSKSIEVLCNGTPFMPWLWAPISLVLKVSSDHLEAFEVIIRAYARIGEALPRFRVLGKVFGEDELLLQSLAVFYSDILRFHQQAYKFVRRPGWQLLFMTSWGRFQRRFDNIIEDLDRHGEQIDKAAEVCNIVEAQKTRQQLEAWRQERLDVVAAEEQEQMANYLQAVSTWLKVDEADQLAILDKILADGQRHPGTCSWVFKNPSIASWLRPQPDTSFVWLRGNPGSGKSIISGQLAMFLRAAGAFLVVTHFCDYSYASSTQYERILQSLLFQLIRRSDDLVAHTYWSYVVAKKSANVQNLEGLLNTTTPTLLSELGRGQSVYIILDGLEEVETEKQRRLINLLNRLGAAFPGRPTVCKIMISCRSSAQLEKWLRRRTTVSLSDESKAIRESICTFALQRLRGLEHRLVQLGFDDQEIRNLAQAIAVKADGMFLWARLVLDYLGTNLFHNRSEINAAVDTLPKKLSEFYERILLSIMLNFDSRSAKRLRRIFGWIAFAKRPLRRLELGSALSFSTGDSTVEEVIPYYIFEMCSSLVEQRRDSSLSFIHVSVKDYLLSQESKIPIREDLLIREHSIACLTCLISGLEVFCPQYSHEKRCFRVLKGLHEFQAYSNQYWLEYVLFLAATPDTLDRPKILASVVTDLCMILERLNPLDKLESQSARNNSGLETNLDTLKGYKGLYGSAMKALEEISQRDLPDSITTADTSPERLRRVKVLSDVLFNYQATVRSVLLLDHLPGISPEELDLFQREHCGSAYTCRLPTCARATAGFETNELRLQHEASHAPRPICSYPKCQYPPFTNVQALRRHEMEHHNSGGRTRTLRRVGCIPSSERRSTTNMVPRQGVHEGDAAESGQANTGSLPDYMDFDYGSDSIKLSGQDTHSKMKGRKVIKKHEDNTDNEISSEPSTSLTGTGGGLQKGGDNRNKRKASEAESDDSLGGKGRKAPLRWAPEQHPSISSGVMSHIKDTSHKELFTSPIQPAERHRHALPAEGIPRIPSSKSRVPRNSTASKAKLTAQMNNVHAAQSALVWACISDEYDDVRDELAKHPEELNDVDLDGHALLHIAAINGNDKIVQLLLDAGCNLDCVNFDKDTPLLDAVDNGHLKVVRLLLDAGADPYKANASGVAPLDRVHHELENFNAEEFRDALIGAMKRNERGMTMAEHHQDETKDHNPTTSTKRSDKVRSKEARSYSQHMPVDDDDIPLSARVLNAHGKIDTIREPMVAAAGVGNTK